MPAATTSVQLSWTNKADWTVRVQANDADTGDLIDLTGAEINVRVVDDRGCRLLDATIDGGVAVVGPGLFEFYFDADAMKKINPGTYGIGAVYSVNGQTNQIFVGSVSIIDGIAQI